MSLLLPVEPWLKFTATQAGRDKVYRTVQYFSRFLAHHLSNSKPLSSDRKELAARFKRLSEAMSLGRKRTFKNSMEAR